VAYEPTPATRRPPLDPIRNNVAIFLQQGLL
jgi:hypothetical protein